jgi:hypothetical protein
MLVISGAILNGCSRQAPDWQAQSDSASSEIYTNNTYVAGRGYYHAPYHSFFPFPYNAFIPGRGYYHGGQYRNEPDRSGIAASSPSIGATTARSTDRGGFARSSSRIGRVYS